MKTTRKCKHCGLDRPIDEFRIISSKKRGQWRQCYCRPCDLLVSRVASRKNLDAARIDGNLDLFAKRLTTAAKARAKQKKMDYDLDIPWVMGKLAPGRCEVTGLQFVFGKSLAGQSKNPWLPSLDRIDSSGGYTKDNVRVVVMIYNLAKSDWTDDQLKTMIMAIKHHQ